MAFVLGKFVPEHFGIIGRAGQLEKRRDVKIQNAGISGQHAALGMNGRGMSVPRAILQHFSDAEDFQYGLAENMREQLQQRQAAKVVVCDIDPSAISSPMDKASAIIAVGNKLLSAIDADENRMLRHRHAIRNLAGEDMRSGNPEALDSKLFEAPATEPIVTPTPHASLTGVREVLVDVIKDQVDEMNRVSGYDPEKLHVISEDDINASRETAKKLMTEDRPILSLKLTTGQPTELARRLGPETVDAMRAAAAKFDTDYPPDINIKKPAGKPLAIVFKQLVDAVIKAEYDRWEPNLVAEVKRFLKNIDSHMPMMAIDRMRADHISSICAQVIERDTKVRSNGEIFYSLLCMNCKALMNYVAEVDL